MDLLAELDEADNKAEFIEYDEAHEGAGSSIKQAAVAASIDAIAKDLSDSPNIRSTRSFSEQQQPQQQQSESARSATSAGKGDGTGRSRDSFESN